MYRWSGFSRERARFAIPPTAASSTSGLRISKRRRKPCATSWKTRGLSRFAVFYQYDAYGFDGLTGTGLALKHYGLDIIARASYTRGTMDVEEAAETDRGIESTGRHRRGYLRSGRKIHPTRQTEKVRAGLSRSFLRGIGRTHRSPGAGCRGGPDHPGGAFSVGNGPPARRKTLQSPSHQVLSRGKTLLRRIRRFHQRDGPGRGIEAGGSGPGAGTG